MKNKPLTKIIIWTLIIILILSLSLIPYFSKDKEAPTLTEKETTPFEIKQCEIDISPDAEITLSINETYTLNANNYQGSLMDVAWISENPMVASFNTHLGDQVNLIAYNEGRTEIIVTDRSMGDDCTDYLFVSVR